MRHHKISILPLKDYFVLDSKSLDIAMPSNDTESYENEQATNRFQNLMLINGLWLLAYFEGKPEKGEPPVFVFGNIELVGTILPCVGILSTTLSTAALWLGLRYLNSHFDETKRSSYLLRIAARGHYHIVPILVTSFWFLVASYSTVGWLWVSASGIIGIAYILCALLTKLPATKNS